MPSQARTAEGYYVRRLVADMTVAEPAEEMVGRLLLGRGMTLAVAESCTGGLIMHRLTNVSGSSRYLLGGVVAYANDAKMAVLGVPAETLSAYGAVSAATAQAMAKGVRQLLRADVGLSVTGIAGPTGDTPGKPLGLTYIALAARETTIWRSFGWTGSRLQNKESSAEAALRLLGEWLSVPRSV